MRFRVLGPLQVRDGADWSTIRAAQQRIVLAILLVEAGRVVSADRIVDEIWGDRPPRTALNTVQGYVARLRRLLGSNANTALVTEDRGYRLALEDGELDSAVFERLAESGRRAAREGRWEAASGDLGAALAFWRGPALADVPATAAVAAEATRLEQCRLSALEARLDAELQLGHHAETVDELHHLVDEYPLRERLRGALMLALYRCGRRAEALETYRRGRAVLVAELGLEPGPQLRSLERAILDDDAALSPHSGPVVVAGGTAVPAQLPADVAGFTGRQAQLDRLDDLLAAGAETGAAVVISAIDGTAGVGKTALAVHWAHRLRDRFADGQLFVNLHGYAPAPPMRPIEALARFLRALGVPADQVPANLEEAAALYRSLLADRRVLVVLDNASHPDQIRPLLPGAPGCLVLVTSRSVLGGLIAYDGARSLQLDVLTTGEARALLERLLGAERVRAEPRAAAELAGLCAHLPLALRLAAAHLIVRPRMPIAGYAERLRGGDRLSALEIDGDEHSAVRATFGLSYRALPADARRLFRLLGSNPGPDFTVEAAAALAGAPAGDTGALLAQLTAGHLVDEHAPGRYRLHDLLRLYARERGAREDDAPERDGAVQRLYEWYLGTVDAAAAILYPQMRRLTLSDTERRSSPDLFDDHTEALAWLDTERPNLVAAVARAADRGPPVAAQLADALRGYFWLRMYTVDWITVAETGLLLAEEAADRQAQTVALLSLADAHYRQGRFRQAVEFSRRALDIARRADWPRGQAAALGNLGNLQLGDGRLPEAVDYHRRALALHQCTGRLAGQANTLGNLGIVHRQRGDLRAALEHFTQALAINRKLESRQGEAVSLTNLGAVWHDLGRLDEAVAHFEQGLALHQEVGNRGGEAETHTGLAAVHCDTGRYTAALEQAHTALALARDAGDRAAETDATNLLGTVHRRLGHDADAVIRYRQARDLARGTSRHAEITATIGLAAARHDLAGAGRVAEFAERSGFRVLAGEARLLVATIQCGRDRAGAAAAIAGHALALHRETGHLLGQARALLVLAHLLDAAGRHERARTHHQEALTLFTGIGAPWAEHARCLLSAPRRDQRT
ncbi:AfsR/SARP family transcriptional regulator [Amycolatopsis anabasis]|uniref:AfsR/SARP family transcriptional regulator n=1 Tax=Amycolatopsis anabasis TaxID=1840409 RepID=UPI00131B611A|nr:BTAD domain-containing putative transcriptional regulator [Amycolatopsis anabasis]